MKDAILEAVFIAGAIVFSALHIADSLERIKINLVVTEAGAGQGAREPDRKAM